MKEISFCWSLLFYYHFLLDSKWRLLTTVLWTAATAVAFLQKSESNK